MFQAFVELTESSGKMPDDIYLVRCRTAKSVCSRLFLKSIGFAAERTVPMSPEIGCAWGRMYGPAPLTFPTVPSVPAETCTTFPRVEPGPAFRCASHQLEPTVGTDSMLHR